jgi:hypothetical protein
MRVAGFCGAVFDTDPLVGIRPNCDAPPAICPSGTTELSDLEAAYNEGLPRRARRANVVHYTHDPTTFDGFDMKLEVVQVPAPTSIASNASTRRWVFRHCRPGTRDRRDTASWPRAPRTQQQLKFAEECVARDPIVGTARRGRRAASSPRRLRPPSRVVMRRVGPIAVLDRLLDGEAIEDRERAAPGGAPGGTGRRNDER